MTRVKITIKKQPASYEWGNILKWSMRELRTLLNAGEITQEEHDIRWRNLLKQEQKYLLTRTQ